MKTKPKKAAPPQVSIAVRIGGPAYTLLMEHAKDNGMTPKHTAEAIILQLGPTPVPVLARKPEPVRSPRVKAMKALRVAGKKGAAK